MRPVWLAVAAAIAAWAVVRRRRLGRVELGLAAGATLAAALYGFGAFSLPNVERLLEDLGAALGSWTYVLVGVGAFAETGAFIGLVAPGESLMVFGGFVAGQGRIALGWLLALVWAAAVCGDTLSFLVGRRLGREFLVQHGPKVKITHDRLEQVERFFARHGGKAILIGRFIGLIRAVAPFVAGASGMAFRRFWPYAVLGAGIYTTTFTLLGYIFWQSFDQVVQYAGRGAFALGTVLVVVVGGVAAYRYLREPEHRAEVRGRLEDLAGRPVAGPPARALLWVARRLVAPAWHGLRGPVTFAWERLTPGELGLELTTLVAILAVGASATVGLAVAVGGAGATPTDARAASISSDLRTALGVDVAQALSVAGSLPVVAVLAALTAAVLVARNHPTEAAVLVAGLVLVAVAVALVGDLVDRRRPVGSIVAVEGPGFPSAIAAYGTAYVSIAVALARGVPALAGRFAVVGVATALAVVIAASRVALAAAHASDALAGLALGAAMLAAGGICGLIVDHVRHNRRRST